MDNLESNSTNISGPDTPPPPGSDLLPEPSSTAVRERSPWMIPILVAIHTEEERNVMTAALAGAGYAVQQAPDGLVALNYLMGASPPLVIVAEEELPEIGGFQIARLLSLKPSPTSRYSAIVLTGSLRAALQRSIQRRLDAITLEVLVKPFPLNELLLAVEMATGRLAGHQRKPRPDAHDTDNAQAET